MNAFQQKKASKVRRAEALLAAAGERLAEALREYDQEVQKHKERGDGFFSREYRLARAEAVAARKHHANKLAQLNTARAESEAPTLFADWETTS